MNVKKLIIIPALFIASIVCAQNVNLTMKPVAKSKYNIEVTSQVDVVQNMAGMEMKVNGSSVAKAVMEIEDVAANGDFTALTTWKEIKSSSSAMGVDTTMNFDNLNLVMKTVYDKTGKIVKNERISTETSSDPGLAMIEQIATGMRLPMLAAKTVKKDEKWSSNTNDTIKTPQSPFAMVTDITADYSFIGTESLEGVEYYRVNVSGPIKVSGEGSQMGMDMHIEGTGSNEGYSLHDKTTLFPALIEAKVGLDMSIIVSGAQSMAIPMTQNVTTITKFTEVK